MAHYEIIGCYETCHHSWGSDTASYHTSYGRHCASTLKDAKAKMRDLIDNSDPYEVLIFKSDGNHENDKLIKSWSLI